MLDRALRRMLPSLLLSVALAGLSACKDEDSDPRTEPPLVRTMVVSPTVDAHLTFSGVVAARVTSDLGFRVQGKVTERLVNVGDVVRRGQPLMRLDRHDYELLARARRNAVAAAEARSVEAATDERRYSALMSSGAVSRQAYDRARTAAATAAADLEAARAQEAVATNEVGYATLVAEADGVVTGVLAEPGDIVAAGQPVVRLAHAGQREAIVHLPETVRPAAQTQAMAVLFAGGATTPAVLRQLSDAADPATRTYEARFTLSGEAASAPLGSTVTIRLNQTDAIGTRLPIGALYDKGQGTGVWIVTGKGDDTAVSWRPVQVSTLEADSAIVSAGVRPGETVVALGAHLLADGQKIRAAGYERSPGQ